MATGESTTIRRLSVAAAVFGVAVLVVIATAPDTAPAPVNGSRVLVVGDSLLQGAADEVEDRLRNAGWNPAIDAFGGSGVAAWRERIRADGEFVQPDIAVVELGTNDCDSACPDLGPLIDRIVDELSAADVILWLTVQEEPDYPRNAEHVNHALREAAARHAKVRLVDFGGWFAGHPEWHLGDGLHLNDAGSEAMADFIANALAPYAPAS
jgi:lysophospholipase L1-like esterase